MADNITENQIEIYKFASLSKYSLRQRFLIYLVDYFLYFTISLIGKTVRFEEVEGWENGKVEGYESYEKAFETKAPGSLAFWHNRLFLTTYFWRKFDAAIMISQSFDGEYISRTAQRFGYGVIRGSSSRGGTQALKKMVKLAQKGIRMALTVDGPRGPRYEVQSGVIHMAKRTRLPIAATLIEAQKFWTVNSWDKLQIPKPFTKAKVFIAEPIFVSADANKEELKQKQKELQKKLDELVIRGKQWRESKK